MHGRVKVKTDLQKAEEKKQRRQEQLNQFVLVREKIECLFKSVQKEDNAESEIQLLKLTESLCALQSDWTIFWKYRQFVFTKRLHRISKLATSSENVDLFVISDKQKEPEYKTDFKNDEKNTGSESSPEDLNREISNCPKIEAKSNFIKELQDEMYLTYRVLIQSPKSYVTWSHRRFCLRSMMSCDDDVGLEYVQKEIKLTETMLTAMTEVQVEDQGRNFHCWDHRRLILTMDKAYSWDGELTLTTKLIKSSISNFSAWHYRSNLLKTILDQIAQSESTNSIIEKELDLVMNAIFTDPEDQSIWIYYKWIISKIQNINYFETILDEHNEVLDDLKDENLKIIRSVSLAQIAIFEKLENHVEIQKLSEYLMKNDPIRKGYYIELQNRYPC